MSRIAPMNVTQFSNLLLRMKTGDCILFATGRWNNYAENLSESDVFNWYFVQKMYLPDFESRFFLIDFCGGTEATAIPFNNCSDIPDEDDMYYLPGRVEALFEKLGLDSRSTVYVKLKSE